MFSENSRVAGSKDMSKPWIHAMSSAKKFGGEPEDYIEIHNLMDSSKCCIADSRHRALTHNSWFVAADGPLERIFGVVIKNSESKSVSVRDIGEQHILEDFGMRFIPTPQDYLQEMEPAPWMNNVRDSSPSSSNRLRDTKMKMKKIAKKKTAKSNKPSAAQRIAKKKKTLRLLKARRNAKAISYSKMP